MECCETLKQQNISFFLLKTAVILSLQQIRPGGGKILSSKCLSRQQHKCTIQAVRIHVCNTSHSRIDAFGAGSSFCRQLLYLLVAPR